MTQPSYLSAIRPPLHPVIITTNVRSPKLKKSRQGKWHKAKIAVYWIIPGLVACVALTTLVEDTRVEAGEILVATLDNDHDFQYPHRYREGIFEFVRMTAEMRIKMPMYDVCKSGAWMFPPEPKHAKRDTRARQMLEVGQEHIFSTEAFIMALKQRIGDREFQRIGLSFELEVGQLLSIPYRPYAGWARRIGRELAARHCDEALAMCELIEVRTSLEPIMSRLSHTLYEVQRLKGPEGILTHQLPLEERQAQAAQIEATIPQLQERATYLRGQTAKLTKDLNAAADELRDSDPEKAKDKLKRAFMTFDLIASD